jgi:uncharacterized protein
MDAHVLLALQSVDSAIDRLSTRERALDSGTALTDARAQADVAETALGELRLRLDTFDRDATKLEHEIDSISQKAAAEQHRLYDGSVANAKELESITREVENLKRRQSDREDELLVVLEQREEVERAAKEADATSSDLRAGVDRVATEAETELTDVRASLETDRAERARLAAQVDPELLELYEDLRRQKKGIGAVALVDGVCQGCHEQLSAVELDRLKRTDGVPRCDHCRRILVL